MTYKPDHYHQTNPPCELKKSVMGRQGSKKGQKKSTISGEGSECSDLLGFDLCEKTMAFLIDKIRTAEVGIPIEKLFDQGGKHITKKKYGAILIHQLCDDLEKELLPNVKLNRL